MRLIRLLSVGKSWMNVRSEPSRYHVVRGNLLPNLQLSIHQAGRADSKLIPAMESAPVSDSSASPNSESKNNSASASRVVNSPSDPSIPSRPHAKSARHDPDGPVGTSYAARLWSKLLHPFSSVSAPAENRPARRGGARLDAVQVVRNDLTEVDLELVGVPGNLGRERAGGKLGIDAEGTRKTAKLSRFAAQLFEVGRSRH